MNQWSIQKDAKELIEKELIKEMGRSIPPRW
jgi:hypothetical protein